MQWFLSLATLKRPAIPTASQNIISEFQQCRHWYYFFFYSPDDSKAQQKVSATTVIQTDLKMAKPWIWRIAYGGGEQKH